MNVISRKVLKEFWIRYPDSETAIQAWFQEAKSARWKSSADIKRRFRTASIIDSERVVFNICGNKYRIIVRINFASATLFVRFIGTHDEYDRIDARKI